MEGRKLAYFASDVHLGLENGDEDGREERFVSFLNSIPVGETSYVFLLGDIWDFWYEYKYVVPKGYYRVFAAIDRLIASGVRVFFFPGNHDVWAYSYFKEIGMVVMDERFACIDVDGEIFCLGHGDGLGDVPTSYRFLRALFHNKVAQALFSTLHPRIAFSLGRRWSHANRFSRNGKYVFKGTSEPLYRFAESLSEQRKVGHFIFGHYHSPVEMELPSGAHFNVLDDWFEGTSYAVWDGKELKQFNNI